MAREEDLPGFWKWTTEGHNLLQCTSLKVIEAMKLGLGFRLGTFVAKCKLGENFALFTIHGSPYKFGLLIKYIMGVHFKIACNSTISLFLFS